jgi:hypothetical protein
MSKIGNVTDYAVTTPATADMVIGTDVSDTSNDSTGETVNFTMSAIKTLVLDGSLLDSELTSIADVKALDQSVVSGAAPVFASTNMTVVDTDLLVVDTTNLQTFVDGVDHALLKARGTGVSTTYVSTVAVGGTTFAQPAVEGEIRSDEGVGFFDLHYAGATGVTVANLNADSTYVYIDNAGALQQQTSVPTRLDWRRKLFTMRIAVNTATNLIIGFEYFNNPLGNDTNTTRDLYEYLLLAGVPLKSGMAITGRADGLGFDAGAGSILELGGTGNVHNPNVLSFDAVTTVSYDLLNKTGVAASAQTALVKFWDDDDAITGLGSTTAVGHRVYRFSNGAFAIQYGQGNYADLALAKSGILLEDYELNPKLLYATFLGWWLIQETATVSNDATKVEFVPYTIGSQAGSSNSLSSVLLKANNGSDVPVPATFLANIGGTGVTVSTWDTAGRPSSPVEGMFGYNTTTPGFEGYTDEWGAVGGGGGIADSADTDLTNDPDAALRRDIAVIAIDAALLASAGVAAYSANYDLASTAAIDESFNVASITDVSSGNTTLGFTSNFSTALYRTANGRRGNNTLTGNYVEALEQKTGTAYTTSTVGLLSYILTPTAAALSNIATNHSTGFGTLA